MHWAAEETAETFQAFLQGGDEGPFLRTGDLGFCVDNELFIAGRLKDLIIIRGRNIYPQDIEQIVEKSHPLLRQGCCAAFAIEGPDTEQLVIVQEVVHQWDYNDVRGKEAVQAICQAVLSEFGVEVTAIELLRAGTISKTTSGKIQRRACRSRFLAGELDAVYSFRHTNPPVGVVPCADPPCADLPSADPVRDWLVKQIAERAHVDAHAVDVNAPVVTFGLSSLEVIALSNEWEKWLGRFLSPTQIYESPSIDALARSLEETDNRRDNALRPSASPQRINHSPLVNPLSQNQKALWFHFRLAPESVGYNLLYAIRIRSRLDVAALRLVLEILVSRHPILTSTYTLQNGEPVQQIQQNQPFLQEIDTSSTSLDDLKVLLHEESNRPIDLTKGPAFRLQLYRRADDDYVLGFIIHHIAADFWALDILVEETQDLYLIEKTGLDSLSQDQHEELDRRKARLREPVLQHADYVRWQQAMLQSEEGEHHWRYWQNALAGDLPILHLPTDRPRPPIQTYNGALYNFSLSADLAQRLRALASENQVTLFMLMLTAYQVLLHRYSDQDDILVGVPTLGRTHSELERVIGSLTNPVVVRARFGDHSTFKELLHQTERGILAAIEHQDIPFSFLVERLQPVRDPSFSPIYQTLFIWNRTRPLNATPLLSLEPFAYGQQGILVDMSLMMFEMEGRLSGNLSYNTDLFDGSTISRMVEHFLTLLDSIVDNPDQYVQEIPLLPEYERQMLLVEWNATQEGDRKGSSLQSLPMPLRLSWQDLCIHQIFEQQVERTPDAIAVVFDDIASGFTPHLTYYELNGQANQLAHCLLEKGVGPDMLVGMCMERSVEMVVALLAVLKAGGAYVPLDPSYPQERLAFLLEDAQVTVVLTQTHLCDLIGQAHKQLSAVELICLEGETSTEAKTSARHNSPQEYRGNLARPVQPENLAYLIYTSGSTGQPKGAMNTHQGTYNRLGWMQQTYQLTPSDRVLQKTPFSFDVSVWEFFWPLTTGASIIVASPGGHQDPAYLSALIAKQQVTTLHFVPSMLQAFLVELNVQNCGSLRRVICSGETLSAELAARFFARVPEEVQLHNLYGPTEAAIDVTFWQCQREVVDGGKLHPVGIPIGRPIANTQIYLLDRNLSPVPIGVTGELYIGGVGLARGYHNRPDLTAERFIANPFVTNSFVETGSAQGTIPTVGVRLYRTGDLARYLPDGVIEYLERIDSQVKLRGFRIELGEIEATLRAYPAVQNAVAVLREESEERKYLIAYVIAEGEERPTHDDLHIHLRRQLPEYMVPANIVFLERLPLTPNGKIDRKALPAPDWSQLQDGTEMVPPQTPLQEQLARIWAELLRLPQVSIGSNFFEVGGHSLLAAQLIVHIQTAFEVKVPLRSLFEAPTIAEMAEIIEQMQKEIGAQEKRSQLSITPRKRDANAIPLSFAQERLWFLDQLAPNSAWYVVSLPFHLSGPLQVKALERSLTAIVQRHEILRTTFSYLDGRPVQVITPDLMLQVPVIDLGGLPTVERDQQVKQILKEDASHTFDLMRGSLLRVHLLRLVAGQAQGTGSAQGPGSAQGTIPTVPEEHVLLFTMHHIISDGKWSMGILLHELSDLYQAELQGKPSPLPALPIQYADYAIWQRQQFQGGGLGQAQGTGSAQGAIPTYWRRQLEGAPPLLELPTDRPRPAVQTDVGTRQSLLLPPTLQQELKRLSQGEGVTLFMTLLAAFQILLMRYSGKNDIVVGTPITDRRQAGLEDLIGFFVNMLVLRSNLSGNPSFRQLLARVREVALQAYEHQDLPFEKLVESQVAPDQRSLSYSPLVQVLFALQNAPIPDIKLANLTLRQMEREHFTTLFDLSLVVTEEERGLLAEVEYSTDLFNATTIARLLSHWQVLLEAIVRDPEQAIETLPLLTEEEREQVLIEWNATQEAGRRGMGRTGAVGTAACPYPIRHKGSPLRQGWQDLCIHQLFEQQAQHNPDAVALVCEEQTLTYAELNRRANQLAHHLQTLGVGPEVVVGICLPRSLQMVVGLLAILKAGGAYLPLDPTYPPDRLAFILEHSQVRVLITEHHLRTCIPAENASLTFVDADVSLLVQLCDTDPQTSVTSDNLAYIIYTSGSTGRPKGVPITHANLLNLVFWHQQAFNVAGSDRATQIASPAFDAMGWEVWPYLVLGASVFLLPDEEIRITPSMLRDWLIRHSITITFLPTALAESVLDQQWPSTSALRFLLTGADALHRYPSPGLPFALINNYGPTEATVVATSGLVPSREREEGPPSIGGPITNTQIYILDKHLQPTPIGIPGELYIGGAGLARGYLADAELTAEKFLPCPFVETTPNVSDTRGDARHNPHGADPGTRLYRTGDLARYRPDGTIEYLGRSDGQVKLRGFRIELGEIEAVLRACPARRGTGPAPGIVPACQ